MPTGRTTVALLALAAAGTVAAAGEPPTPRAPIGPRDPFSAMLPSAMDPFSDKRRLSEDRVRIVNIGDQQLSIAYWDETAWRPLSIAAGRPADVVCAKCAGAITVAFHNGRQNETLKVKGGQTYVLSWSTQAGAWVLTASGSQ